MALVRAIGFEWRNVNQETGGVSNWASISTDNYRSGRASMKIMGGYMDSVYYATIPLPASLSEFYLQFGLYLDGNTNAMTLLRWRSGTTTLGGMKITADRKFELYVGDMATVATSSKAIEPYRWYVLELYVKIADTGGEITLRIDYEQAVTYSGDTKPGTDTGIDSLVLCSASCDTYFDDVIVHDTTGSYNNSWPGGGKIVLLRPDSDGGILQWTPTPSGAHYSTIDDVPSSGSDYIQAGSADLVDEVGLSDLPSEAVTIKGVVGQAIAFKGSSSPPTTLALGLQIGGSSYYSSDLSLGTSAGLVSYVWDNKPGGGVFTTSEINGASLLLKSRP